MAVDVAVICPHCDYVEVVYVCDDDGAYDKTGVVCKCCNQLYHLKKQEWFVPYVERLD